jgi:hypothetical protein
LRKQVSEKTELLEDDVRTAEREYATRLQELDGGFEVNPLLVEVPFDSANPAQP